MYGVRRNLDYTRAAEKKIWHPFTLQQLEFRNFVRIANKILAGDYGLLTYDTRRMTNG